ncbi:MAG: hypothetical protein BGO41_00685 [Clostridiales bacterium 38-18]|nr:MAG: hypothetical protein BGO41_00685 [Clostridiales bacterium 38-18]
MSKASNIQKLIDYLRRHERVSRDELAQYLNVDKKTVTNYINDINADHHIHIESVTGKYGGYTLKEINLKVVIDKSELNALAISEKIVKKLRPEIYPEYKSLSEKLKQIYNTQNETEMSSNRSFITASTNLHSIRDRKIEDQLNRVIIERQTIELNYEDVNKTKILRIVDPYEMFCTVDGLYLIAYCHLRQDIRFFKLNRIMSFKRSGENFQTKVDYNPEMIFENNIGIHMGNQILAKLRISTPFDVIISEKQWFKTQKITRENDNCILFEADISEDEETISWLLSMKEFVEVISPESLRTHYLETVKKIFYKNFN